MNFTDEKDYLMRMIKEMVSVLFSLMLGKKYTSVELENEDKFQVSGRPLKDFKAMIDRGQINEAENILLDEMDYTNQDDVITAALFYQYLNLNQRIIAGNAQFTGIAAGRGVGFTTGLLLLREGLGMRETPIRPHSWH